MSNIFEIQQIVMKKFDVKVIKSMINFLIEKIEENLLFALWLIIIY